jgi:protein gp37
MKVKFFFTQWGGTNKKAAGRILVGRTRDDLSTKLLARLMSAK